MAIVVSPRSSLSNNLLTNLDTALFLKINDSHYKALDQIMIYLSGYGREAFWILTILLLFMFGKKRDKKTIVILSITMIALMPIGIGAKEIIERPRPIIPDADFLMPANSEFAYPSGHALMVSAGATIVLANFRGSAGELTISIFLTIMASLVCFSRIYVGHHYPLDVLGGILLGVGISFLFIWKEKDLEFLYFQTNKLLKRFSR